MTTSFTRQRDLILPSDVTSVEDLIAEMDAANERQSPHDSGVFWFFETAVSREIEFTLGFCIGVRGRLGALLWDDGERGLIPENGVNPGKIDYFTGGYGHHMMMPVGAEVPIEVAYAALREFIATGQRPTCVNWRQAPEV